MRGSSRSFVALVAVGLALGHANVVSAAITAAFVDLDRTPLGGALEAKLLASPNIQWVERAHLELMLKEKRLQAAFSAEGAAARLELGKLLHADVLVLLRKQTASPSTAGSGYELVICETRRGLRTTSLVLIESKAQPLDAAKLAPALLERVVQATQEIRFIYTVPPLISRDLAYRYSHLQRGFAELLTQRLLAQPGTAVVESAEARAIAAERLIASNPAGRADYAAPVLVTGEFRHVGEGDAERVRIQLTARRGETAVGAAFDRELAVGEVATALTAWTDELAAAGANQVRVPPVDRDAEAKRLLDRGRELFVWHNLDEAWALAEAGLLYRPDDLALRRLAFDAVSEIFHGHFFVCRVRAEVWPPMRIAFLRTCDHLEFLARHDGNMVTVPGTPPYWSSSYFGMLRSVKLPPSDEAKTILDELAPLENAMLIKLHRIRTERGFHYDAQSALERYLRLLPPEKMHSEMVRYVLEVPQNRDTEMTVNSMVHRQFYYADQSKEPKLAILGELKTHTERPDIVAIVTRMEASTIHIDALQAQREAADAEKAWPDLSPPGAPFREIHWKIRRTTRTDALSSESLQPLPLESSALWLIPIGPQLDLALNNLGAYLVRTPGVLDPLWETTLVEPISTQEAPCYDGRYLWAMTIGSRRSLIVLDPTTGKVWRGLKDLGITAGLAADDQRARQQSSVMITPLRPGEIFVVATHGRTLLARAKFNPEATPPISLTTVYECPESAGKDDDGRNPKLSFKASYLATLPRISDHTQSPQHILIGRTDTGSRAGLQAMSSKERQAHVDPTGRPAPATSSLPPRSSSSSLMKDYPLLVDLATNCVEVIQTELSPPELSSGSTGVAVAGNEVFYTFGSRYTIGTTKGTTTMKFLKFDIAERTTTVLDADAPIGFVFFSGDETHIVGGRWWNKKPGDPQFTRVTPTVPWTAVNLQLAHGSKFDEPLVYYFSRKTYSLQRIYNSAHYGPVLYLAGENVAGRVRYHYVQLDVHGPIMGRP